MWTTSSDNPQRLGSIPSSESCSIFGVTIISNLLDRLTTSLAVCTILHPPVKPWRWFPIARCQTKDDGDWGYRERGIWQSGPVGTGWQGDYRSQTPGTGSRTASWAV